MLFGFVDRVSSAGALKEMLDTSAARQKVIASRVSQASLRGDGFAVSLAHATDESGAPIDVEQEMVQLADVQIRFDTAAKLLEKTYASLRLAMKDR